MIRKENRSKFEIGFLQRFVKFMGKLKLTFHGHERSNLHDEVQCQMILYVAGRSHSMYLQLAERNHLNNVESFEDFRRLHHNLSNLKLLTEFVSSMLQK